MSPRFSAHSGLLAAKVAKGNVDASLSSFFLAQLKPLLSG